MIVRFEWIFCCKNSAFSCLKNEKNIHLINMLSEYAKWTLKKMDQHVLSKWPLKKSSQKGGDAITLRREEYHKLGYVVTCGE